MAEIDGSVLDRLFAIVASRRGTDPAASYTAKLMHEGRSRIAQKLGEEAVETALAAVGEDRDALIAEAADLLYHLLVVLEARGVALAEVEAALSRRMTRSGLEEKASRPRD